jgi:signal transduction histidine kinase
VAAFDGRIDVDTAIGAGTRIAISIPIGAGV